MIENAVSSFETIEITTSLNTIHLMLVGVKGKRRKYREKKSSPEPTQENTTRKKSLVNSLRWVIENAILSPEPPNRPHQQIP